MIRPTMDPAQWREETERVALKLKNLNQASRLGGDWMDHLSMLKEYVSKSNLDNKMIENDTNKGSSSKNRLEMNKNGTSSHPSSSRNEENSASIVENLKKLKIEISNSLASICRSETMINSKEKSTPLSLEYSIHSKVNTCI